MVPASALPKGIEVELYDYQLRTDSNKRGTPLFDNLLPPPTKRVMLGGREGVE